MNLIRDCKLTFFYRGVHSFLRLDVSPLNGYDGQWRKGMPTSFQWYPFVILFKYVIHMSFEEKINQQWNENHISVYDDYNGSLKLLRFLTGIHLLSCTFLSQLWSKNNLAKPGGETIKLLILKLLSGKKLQFGTSYIH